MAEWIVEIVDGIPHIKTMIPLVRCKDCKHRYTVKEFMSEETTPLDDPRATIQLRPVCDLGDEGFCSRGEKVTE